MKALLISEIALAHTIRFENPLRIPELWLLVERILNIIFALSLPLVSILVIISGILIVTAGGDEKKVETGKRLLTYTLIGFIIIIMSWGIVRLLAYLLLPENNGGGFFPTPIEIFAHEKLDPPLRDVRTLPDLLGRITNFFFIIALFLLPVVIVIGGLFFVTAGGDPEQIEKGKRIMIYGVIGLVILLTASGLIALIRAGIGLRN